MAVAGVGVTFNCLNNFFLQQEVSRLLDFLYPMADMHTTVWETPL